MRHLFAANELLAYTLASLHNLYFILDLMRQIRERDPRRLSSDLGTSSCRATIASTGRQASASLQRG